MSLLSTSAKRVVVKDYADEDSDLLGSICRNSDEGDAGSAGATNMEAEKRIRREIANSNERRRMQSINAGFQSLRTLLPHHEGEKLSKAAILQQTAEYIYNLEQEKTRLLSQNCQLMRQVHQHEGGDIPPKKRKTELIIPAVQAVSESSDEGQGSLSPEPVGIVITGPIVQPPVQPPPAQSVASSVGGAELLELRRQLEHERTLRTHLEEQLRNMENQIYQQIQYQPQEVIEHSDGIRGETLVTVIHDPDDIDMQLVTAENLPPVAQTQTVVCSPQLSRSPSPVPSPSPPTDPPPRLPSALEAAIKAEPKVEVERLPSPATPHDDVGCGRIYVANTSRQNLETIVEAIRHLEGDHLFGDEPSTLKQQHALPQQEMPLALTNKAPAPERLLKVEMNPYLQFHTTSVVQQQQQSRPGVIVVKQHS